MPDDFVIRPIRATRKHPYVYADDYLATMTSSPLIGNEALVVAEAGDLFIGLDLTSRIAPYRQRDFLRWHALGVRFAFVIYDMLPYLHPEWFTARSVQSFKRWLTVLAIHSDAVFCISQTVASEAGRFSQLAGIERFWFHLGVDVPTTTQQSALMEPTAVRGSAYEETNQQILMIGTIEPRKGHQLVLDAFELLWRAGSQASLVIVGRPGWAVEALTTRLVTHPEFGKRLQWRRDADDATVEKLYATSHGLILASEGEGFGLPIIEAARYRLPLFLRDLPVFREIAHTHATYFSTTDAAALASKIAMWLDAIAASSAPDSGAIAPLSWHDSALQLRELIAQLARLS
ncbi:MAG: glycosyltransferase family 1 protein [Burkholderia gladioli]